VSSSNGKKAKLTGSPVPVIVTLYHREPFARLMFEQLDRVTDDYSLILVDNGFDDHGLIEKLKPLHYIGNETNTGAIRPINQGLEVAEGKYVAVLHSDLLIYDEGWLDHIVDFMERRPDVGMVGLAGRHTINEDGSLDFETTVVDMIGYPESLRPTWRFTEVACIDGLGWVMRDLGFRLEESFGLMHFYDIDLSLQYIEAGYRVYAASVDLLHLADRNVAEAASALSVELASARDDSSYLRQIGGDDQVYYEEVREKFRRKWSHLLPITRGFADEAYFFNRIADMIKHIEDLEAEDRAKAAELLKAKEYFKRVESEIAKLHAEIDRLNSQLAEKDSDRSPENTQGRLIRRIRSGARRLIG
jgi:glycosyltransferase involved in cell wall biosynthesis